MPNLIKTSHFCRKLLLNKPDKREIWKTRSSKRDLLYFICLFELFILRSTDSQAEILYTIHSVPSRGKSYMIAVEHHTQETGIDVIHQTCPDFTSLYVLVCVRVFSSLPFAGCGLLQPSHHSQGTQQLHHDSPHATLSQPRPPLSLTNTSLRYF